MLMKRREKIIGPQFRSHTRTISKIKNRNKKKYEVISINFGKVRPIERIKPMISTKYG